MYDTTSREFIPEPLKIFKMSFFNFNDSTLKLVNQSLSNSDFHTAAKNISDNPLARIPSTEVQFLDPNSSFGDGKVFIDCHTHSFNIDYIPRNFEKLLKVIDPTKIKRVLKRWSDILNIPFLAFLTKNSVDVINKLADVYEESVLSKDGQQTKKVYFVNLMMDMERSIFGGVKKSYEEQIIDLINIRNNKIPQDSNKEHDYSKMILPFLAVDPHNKDIYKQFLKVFAPGEDLGFLEFANIKPKLSFVGVKLYPPLGYTPTDPTLFEIFKVCQEKNIPVLTHVGGYRTRAEDDNVEIRDWTFDPATNSVKHRVNSTKIALHHKNSMGQKVISKVPIIFIQPKRWEPVFQFFTKLKVCIAHMGDNDQWLRFREIRKELIANNIPLNSATINSMTGLPHGLGVRLTENHVFQSLQLISKYPNAYADVSYSFVVKENSKIMAELMMDDHWSKKLLYGSDFYMTEVEKHGRWTEHPTLMLYNELNKKDPKLWEAMSNKNVKKFLFA